MATIILIRHGENNAIGKKLTGRLPGVHLNEAGRAQAQHLAEALAEIPIKAVYTSPLERTLETAEPIADIHNLSVEVSPSLLEIDFGEFQGVEMKELGKKKFWKALHDDPTQVRLPGGENYTEAQNRLVQGVLQINSQHNEKDTVVCVSHCDSIRLIVSYFLGQPLENFHRINIAPASLSVLYLQAERIFFGPINYTCEFPDFSEKPKNNS
jgi:probable phosphomutase (TIGR03848 family)